MLKEATSHAPSDHSLTVPGVTPILWVYSGLGNLLLKTKHNL